MDDLILLTLHILAPNNVRHRCWLMAINQYSLRLPCTIKIPPMFIGSRKLTHWLGHWHRTEFVASEIRGLEPDARPDVITWNSALTRQVKSSNTKLHGLTRQCYEPSTVVSHPWSCFDSMAMINKTNNTVYGVRMPQAHLSGHGNHVNILTGKNEWIYHVRDCHWPILSWKYERVCTSSF